MIIRGYANINLEWRKFFTFFFRIIALYCIFLLFFYGIILILKNQIEYNYYVHIVEQNNMNSIKYKEKSFLIKQNDILVLKNEIRNKLNNHKEEWCFLDRECNYKELSKVYSVVELGSSENGGKIDFKYNIVNNTDVPTSAIVSPYQYKIFIDEEYCVLNMQFKCSFVDIPVGEHNIKIEYSDCLGKECFIDYGNYKKGKVVIQEGIINISNSNNTIKLKNP